MLLTKGSSSFLRALGGVIFLRQRQKNIYVELLVWTLVGILTLPRPPVLFDFSDFWPLPCSITGMARALDTPEA